MKAIVGRARCFQVSGSAQFEAQEERQVGMLDIYPEFAARPPAGARSRLTATYVQVETEDGAYGTFGPIFPETAALIQSKLTPFLVGKDVLATERTWDVLYRQDRHARKGYEMMAISAVDNALWDLKGKLFDLPLYRLLGGPTRDRVPCYASMLGYSHEPAKVRERAQLMVERGFKAEKWFFRYGPSDGLEGMEKNVALVRTVRDAVGPNVEIMLDCWMGWDVTYAIRMLERIEEFRPRWVEEPLPADRIGEFGQIRRTSRIPISTGEHEYTRWGFLQLLQAEGVDVIQADPDWCGGVSELVKICTLASAFGKHVIPHGHSVYAAASVIAATPPITCPMAEYLVRGQPAAQHFHTHAMAPEQGAIPLPEAPGLGIEIDDSKVEERREL